MAKKYWYYFRTSYGMVTIVKSDFEINTEINRCYHELTDDQRRFYKNNPSASVSEVTACKLIEEPSEEEFDLEGYKKDRLKALSEKSLVVLGEFVSEYQLMNARLSLEASGELKIYDDEVSQHYVDLYLLIGGRCRSIYYSAKSEIESAQTKIDVDTLYDYYYARYTDIEE